MRSDQSLPLRLIIVILCLITTMGRFVMDNYLPSLPAISLAFNTSVSAAQLTVSLYIFGFGLSQLIYGPLSDRYGRKKILVGGLLLFIVANTLCAFTNSFGILLLTRLLSGIGMGVCGVLNRAIASDCFSGAAFSKAWSYTTTTLVLVLILAPLIGSGVQELFGWRANFSSATIFVSIALAFILWKLPETHQHKPDHPINIKTVLGNYHKILLSRSFVVSTLCYTFAFAGLVAYFQLSPFLFIRELHLTTLEYGYTSLAIAAGYLAGGMIVSQLARILGIKVLLVLGILLVTASGIFMLSWNYDQAPTVLSVLFPTSIYVVGARIIIPNAVAGAFTGFRHLGGSTSGLIGGIQMLGTALICLIMQNFNYRSPLPLAILFTLVGISSFAAFCFMYFYKNKYFYKNFVQLSVGAIHLYRTRLLQQWLSRYLVPIDLWLHTMLGQDYKMKIKIVYRPLLHAQQLLLSFCQRYRVDELMHRILLFIRENIIKRMLAIIKASSLYHYFSSAIQFSLKLSNRKANK